MRVVFVGLLLSLLAAASRAEGENVEIAARLAQGKNGEAVLRLTVRNISDRELIYHLTRMPWMEPVFCEIEVVTSGSWWAFWRQERLTRTYGCRQYFDLEDRKLGPGDQLQGDIHLSNHFIDFSWHHRRGPLRVRWKISQASYAPLAFAQCEGSAVLPVAK